MKKIRWGIAGPGCIANKFANAVKNVDCAELVAVASRSYDSANDFAQKYDIPNVFAGYESMADSDCVDAVYISTAHPFHFACAELFMSRGKHILCEKPLCINEDQATRLKECAAKNNVFLMEAMWTRFLPAIEEISAIVKSGEIGDVVEVHSDFCYASSPDEETKLFLNSMAGGSILDVGVYGLHFASIFLGSNPCEVSCVSQVEAGVDTHAHITLKYPNGAIASITSAIVLQKPETAFVYGTKGYIQVPTFYGATEFSVCVDGTARHVSKPSVGDGFEEEIYEVCNSINMGKTQSDVLPLNESIAIIKIMDNARSQIGVKYPFDGE